MDLLWLICIPIAGVSICLVGFIYCGVIICKKRSFCRAQTKSRNSSNPSTADSGVAAESESAATKGSPTEGGEAVASPTPPFNETYDGAMAGEFFTDKRAFRDLVARRDILDEENKKLQAKVEEFKQKEDRSLQRIQDFERRRDKAQAPSLEEKEERQECERIRRELEKLMISKNEATQKVISQTEEVYRERHNQMMKALPEIERQRRGLASMAHGVAPQDYLIACREGE